MEKKKRFYIDYIGCEKRKLDAQRFMNYFSNNELIHTWNVNEADIILYVTCAFNNESEKISIKNIEEIDKKRKKGSILIIAGCLTDINPQRLMQYKNTYQLKVRKSEEIDKIFDFKIPFRDISDTNITIFENREYKTRVKIGNEPEALIEYEKAKKGYKIRLNYGCLLNCSYCVTKLATKKLKSKPIDIILNEFKQGLENKHKTFFLTGGDLGAYGIDISTNIVNLLSKIFIHKDNFKIYLHDFGVHWLLKYSNSLIELLKKNQDKIGVFNFPIQSGSDRILKLMKRPYNSYEVIKVLSKLKKEVPKLKIGTHIIIGFPTETEDDYNSTINLINKIDFDFVMFFPYSDNPFSEAYKFQPKIPQETIEERLSNIKKIFRKKINNKSKFV